MALNNLFRRYSMSNDLQSGSNAFMNGNPIAETLLEELESQCRISLAPLTLQNKRGSEIFTNSTNESVISTYDSSLKATPNKRHASVDYSWLTPNNKLSQPTNDAYHLPDIIKMELSDLILNVLAEDCTLIINQFRRHIRAQTKSSTPESIIALFRKTICEHFERKSKNWTNTNNIHDTLNSNNRSNAKYSTGIYSMVRNNRINPKHQFDDERHCIAELTEISVSSSNDGQK